MGKSIKFQSTTSEKKKKGDLIREQFEVKKGKRLYFGEKELNVKREEKGKLMEKD